MNVGLVDVDGGKFPNLERGLNVIIIFKNDTMDTITNDYPETPEAVHWEDLYIEMYHMYNEGTDEFLKWLGE